MKKTIYIDFDNTLVESNKKIIELINNKYNVNKTEDDLIDYDYNSIFPITKEEKIEMFESDEFYKNLEMKPLAVEILEKYHDIYEIIIVSNGTKLNLQKKMDWIRKNIPYDNFKFIGIDNCNPDKSKINMKDAIQIDDNIFCLDSTNAGLKILYKDFNNFSWQSNYGGKDILIVNTWNDINSILEFCMEYDYKTLKKNI